MKKYLLAVLFAATAVTAGCVIETSTPRDNRPAGADVWGSQTYDVSFSDPNVLYDTFGYPVDSRCNGRVSFEGWLDTDCYPPAMISSRALYSVPVSCGYYDIDGYFYSYTGYFDFIEGYISERCGVYYDKIEPKGLTASPNKEITIKKLEKGAVTEFTTWYDSVKATPKDKFGVNFKKVGETTKLATPKDAHKMPAME